MIKQLTQSRSSLASLLVAVCAIVVLSSNLAANDLPAKADISSKDYEPDVLEIIETIKNGELDAALELADAHVEQYPKSRIGHLLRADILQAMVHNPIALTNQTPELNYSPVAETTQGIRHQLKNRWLHHTRDLGQSHDKVPASLVDMGRHEHAMVTDMQAGRLYLYRNVDGSPELIRDYYLTVGSEGYGKEVEGDNKTPIGVYSINQHIAGSELPDLYGKGAYPVDYPNTYDRALNRTGYGIWLHGTPSNTYARAPWASEGCFVLSNEDLVDIEQFIDVEERTPVVLAESIEWVSKEALAKRRALLTQTINEWKEDWESLDTQAYLRHYSRDYFDFGTSDFEPWAKRKHALNDAKTFVQVDVSIDSLFLYPGTKDMFVVRYTQNYLSNNFAGSSQKQQYWQRNTDGRWQIVHES